MTRQQEQALGPGAPSEILRELGEELLSSEQLARLVQPSMPASTAFDVLVKLDSELGGCGLHNINSWRWAISERDVWRPLQYCSAHFRMLENPEWLTRAIVADCGLHLERLVARVTGRRGEALGKMLVRQRGRIVASVGEETWSQLRRFADLHNLAKHDVDRPVGGGHLFSPEDARVAYSVCRRLAVGLYRYAGVSATALLPPHTPPAQE